MASKIVIGGGTGFIGKALSDLLRRKGHSVTVISRQEGRPDRISWSHLKEYGLPPETKAVVNLSGAPVINPRERFNIEEYKKEVRSSRIDTSKWLTEAIKAAPVKPEVWISASAVGFYPTSSTAVYDEDSPGGTDEYPALLVKEWEQAARLPENCEDVRQVVIRIGLTVGKGGGVVQNMTMPFWLGLGGPFGSGKQWFPWVHVHDVAGIFAHAIENHNVSGIMNAVSPETATNEEFSKEFAASMNRPAFFRAPEFVIRCLLGEDWSLMLLKGQNVVPKRTLDSGYKFVFPNLTDAIKNVNN